MTRCININNFENLQWNIFQQQWNIFWVFGLWCLFQKWWIFNQRPPFETPRLRPGSCEKSCGRLRNNRSTNIPSFEKDPQNLFKSCSLAFGVEEMFQTKARRHRGTVSKEHAFAYPTPCWCESTCFTAGERTDVPPAFRVSPLKGGMHKW